MPVAAPVRFLPHLADAPAVKDARLLSDEEINAVPALHRLASNGAKLSELGTVHGMRGIFARNGERFQVFYMTPDNSAVIGGVMWNSDGHDVTRDQVAPIEGTIPTITYDAPLPLQATTAAGAPNPVAQLEHVQYGLQGRAGAPRLWMFIDPLCPFSVRAMDRLRPYIDSGRVQLALIPISINDHENDGASTKAALALLSQTQESMVDAWTRNTAGGIPQDGGPAVALANNMAAAQAIHLRGTPTIIWTTPDGQQHQAAGLPDNLDAALPGLPS
jgi:thiol:disulfide interchange protein DsbG